MTGMADWNELHLEELVRKMGLRRTPGQRGVPIHLSLYGPSWSSEPLLTKIMRLDAAAWSALGYDETDRVSITRYLGSLGCLTDWALRTATTFQQPLTLDLAKALVDVGVFDEDALRTAAMFQQPLTLKLATALIDSGCDPTAKDWRGWNAFVYLARGGYPVDPQVTDLFLSAGCRRDLGGCGDISDRTRLRFDQILKEHAEWKLTQECVPADAFYAPDWGR